MPTSRIPSFFEQTDTRDVIRVDDKGLALKWVASSSLSITFAVAVGYSVEAESANLDDFLGEILEDFEPAIDAAMRDKSLVLSPNSWS